MVKSSGDFTLFQHGEISLFSFGGRDVADGFQEPSMVEPVDPFQGCELDGLQRSPWSASMDHLGLVKTIDGLGQGIVVAVAHASHRRLNASFGQALGVFDRDILAALDALLFVKRLLPVVG